MLARCPTLLRFFPCIQAFFTQKTASQADCQHALGRGASRVRVLCRPSRLKSRRSDTCIRHFPAGENSHAQAGSSDSSIRPTATTPAQTATGRLKNKICFSDGLLFVGRNIHAPLRHTLKPVQSRIVQTASFRRRRKSWRSKAGWSLTRHLRTFGQCRVCNSIYRKGRLKTRRPDACIRHFPVRENTLGRTAGLSDSSIRPTATGFGEIQESLNLNSKRPSENRKTDFQTASTVRFYFPPCCFFTLTWRFFFLPPLLRSFSALRFSRLAMRLLRVARRRGLDLVFSAVSS